MHGNCSSDWLQAVLRLSLDPQTMPEEGRIQGFGIFCWVERYKINVLPAYCSTEFSIWNGIVDLQFRTEVKQRFIKRNAVLLTVLFKSTFPSWMLQIKVLFNVTQQGSTTAHIR